MLVPESFCDLLFFIKSVAVTSTLAPLICHNALFPQGLQGLEFWKKTKELSHISGSPGRTRHE